MLIKMDFISLNNNYEKTICIYLKTGNESQNSLNEIIKEGFSIFNRIDFINLLLQWKIIIKRVILQRNFLYR